MKKIAILMSTYNGEKYLDKQLESLFKQTVEKYITVYVRDDGSDDNTFAIIDSWKNKLDIKLFKCSNVGPAKSFWELLMNKDIVADYYAFCDQDDIWDVDKLDIAIKELKNGVHLYISNCRLIDEKDDLILEKLTEDYLKITIPRQIINGMAQGCSMVFTNELRQYLIDCNPKCIPMHDTVFMLYAMAYGKIFRDSTPRFGYRMHGNNVVAKNNKTNFQKLRTTYWNWLNSGKNSMATVAEELLDNVDNLPKEIVDYLVSLKIYKNSFIDKMRLIFYKDIKDIPYRSLRSYRIRVLFNLF